MNRLGTALLLLSLALIGAGCSTDNDSLGDSTQMSIAYQVSTEQVQTRGMVITNENFGPSGQQFKLWGWMTDSNGEVPMNSDFNEQPLQDVVVKYRSHRNEWTADLTYFWPRPRYRADFYAFYPVDAPFDAATKSITYTDFDGNTDVMYATYSDQRPEKDNLEKQRMAYLSFYHATAQVKFDGLLSQQFADIGYRVEVKNITLHNVYKTTSFTFDASVNEIGEKPGKKLALTLGTASSPGDYSLSMIGNNPTVSSKDESVQLTSDTDVLMILPQTLTAWNPTTETTAATSGSYIALEMRAIAADNSYPLKENGDFITVYAPFTSPTAAGFEPGNIYKYTITLGSTVAMTSEITPWTPEVITPSSPLYPDNP